MSVKMLIVCWVIQHGVLVEAWRVDETVSLNNCLKMNRVFSGGGPRGAITVRCGDPKP